MAFLLFIFVLGPTILILAWYGTKNKKVGKILKYLSIGIFILFFIGIIIKILTDKKVLDKDDYYGEYIVDRNIFAGKQADWQYNNFRFKIKENDSIYFYLTDKGKIIKTYNGKIKWNAPNGSVRIKLEMENPTHHIVLENPTTFRSAWDFYIVFHSSKFNNVYFRKGH